MFMVGIYILIAIIGLISSGIAILSMFYSVYDIAGIIDDWRGIKSVRKSSRSGVMLLTILMWFGWGIFFFQGIRGVLWFIPDSIGGHSEAANWQPLRSSISLLVSFALSYGMCKKLQMLHDFEEHYNESKDKKD